MPKQLKAVVVTTKHGGVFFGYTDDVRSEIIHLRRARNCLVWPPECKGFLGLAAYGPLQGARVGPAADLELRDITSVAYATDEAVKQWESAPWS